MEDVTWPTTGAFQHRDLLILTKFDALTGLALLCLICHALLRGEMEKPQTKFVGVLIFYFLFF